MTIAWAAWAGQYGGTCGVNLSQGLDGGDILLDDVTGGSTCIIDHLRHQA